MSIDEIISLFLVPWLAALSWVVWQFKSDLAEVKNDLTVIDTKLNIMYDSDDEQAKTTFHSLKLSRNKNRQ